MLICSSVIMKLFTVAERNLHMQRILEKECKLSSPNSLPSLYTYLIHMGKMRYIFVQELNLIGLHTAYIAKVCCTMRLQGYVYSYVYLVGRSHCVDLFRWFTKYTLPEVEVLSSHLKRMNTKINLQKDNHGVMVDRASMVRSICKSKHTISNFQNTLYFLFANGQLT